MAPTVVGSSGLNAGAAGFNLAATPAGGAPGVLRIVFLGTASSSTCAVPAGWTTLTNAIVGSGRLIVAYRTFQPGDGTVTFSLSPAAQEAMEVVGLTGADDSNLVITTGGGTSSTAIVAPTATPVVSDSTLVTFHDVTAPSNGTTETLSTPAGMTACAFVNGAASAAHVCNAFTQTLTSTTPTGTRTSTASPTAGNWRAASVVVAAPPPDISPGNFFPYLGV